MKRLLLILLLLAASVPAARADIGSMLQSMLDERVSKWNVPGGVLRVEAPGIGTWTITSGVEDRETNAAMNPAHLFRIGSNTKSFTSAAILRLQERGLLKIDDAIDKYLAGLNIPAADSITIRNLMNHTSGLGEYSLALSDSSNPLTVLTPEELVTMGIAVAPNLDFRPGTGWSYSNTGYIALGMIIERVSGKTYEQFITDEFITPLGLTHTYVPLDASFPEAYAKGYMLQEDGSFMELSFIHPSITWSAGCMVSTVDDLAKWVNALIGGKALKPESMALYREMVPTGSDNMLYSFGIICYNDRFWWHNGGIPEYYSQMWIDAETGVTVTAYVNSYDDENPNVDFEYFCMEVFGNLYNITGVEEKTVPAPFTLGANYPNPFNPSTHFSLTLPEASPVTVEVFNLQGQRIRTLARGEVFSAGIHAFRWDGRDAMGRPAASGVYIYRAATAKAAVARKMNLAR